MNSFSAFIKTIGDVFLNEDDENKKNKRERGNSVPIRSEGNRKKTDPKNKIYKEHQNVKRKQTVDSKIEDLETKSGGAAVKTPNLGNENQSLAKGDGEVKNVNPFLKRMSDFKEMLSKIKKQEEAISKEEFKKIRGFCFKYGAPDDGGERSLLWKMLLGYLSRDPREWVAYLKENRELYTSFVQELVVNPYDNIYKDSDNSTFSGEMLDDDPLGVSRQKLNKHSTQWDEYFKDQEQREEILKDVKRTYSSFHFFAQKVNIPPVSYEGKEEVPKLKESPLKLKPNTNIDETHHLVLLRILFIFAKLNPGIKYVQGMNEILAPIYYVFATDPNSDWNEYAEADAFFCFSNIMAELRDHFIKSLDMTTLGIIHQVQETNEMLKRIDYDVWSHMKMERVDPRYYSFRWLSLLLSQEFELPDILRLWDTLFADEERFDFLLCCCVSMLILIRDRLLDSDFSKMLGLLQNYPSDVDIQDVLAKAHQLKVENKKSSKPKFGEKIDFSLDNE